MTTDKNIPDLNNIDHDEMIKINYHLNTLFDISRDLFGVLDVEEILNKFLVSTLGLFGVVQGFIMIIDGRHRRPAYQGVRRMDDPSSQDG